MPALRFKAIALDMMGVVYPTGDDLRALIVPFLKREGFTGADQEVIEAYRRGYRHGEPAAAFWTSLGFEPPHDAIEGRLMEEYDLVRGAREFLAALQAAGVPTFSISNDVGEWAARRRKHFDIDRYFAGAVVSGDLGVPKPEPAIYQALAKMLPCEPHECLFVDDRAANLDGAVNEGFAAVLFDAKEHETYDAVPDFAELTLYLGLN